MGFFRGGTLVIVSLVLFLAILSTLTFSTLERSSSYENIREEVSERMINLPENPTYDQMEDPFIEEGVKLKSQANKTIIVVTEHCKIAESYTLIYDDHVLTIPCPDIITEETLTEALVSEFIEETYYQEYDCNFLKCLATGETSYLTSSQAKDYWSGKFNIALIITLLLAGAIFILIEQRINWPFIIGGATILSSIALFKIQGLMHKIISSRNIKATSEITEIILNKSTTTFTFAITLGIVLIGVGIYLRFFHSDLVKKKFSREDVKKIIKEEKSNQGKKNVKQQKSKN